MEAETFIRYLEDLKEGRRWAQARAVLRRSLAFPPGAYPPAFPFVEPFAGNREGWQREAFYLVAGLYALKDGAHLPERTLARALREERDKRNSASIEGRFLALLDADSDQIAHRLRYTVNLVEGGLDFVRLLVDLWGWFHSDRVVQAKWAREFYSSDKVKREVEA